jgi:hypothetical protein
MHHPHARHHTPLSHNPCDPGAAAAVLLAAATAAHAPFQSAASKLFVSSSPSCSNIRCSSTVLFHLFAFFSMYAHYMINVNEHCTKGTTKKSHNDPTRVAGSGVTENRKKRPQTPSEDSMGSMGSCARRRPTRIGRISEPEEVCAGHREAQPQWSHLGAYACAELEMGCSEDAGAHEG